MTALLSAVQPPRIAVDGEDYQPGVCNIGPDEIARRRRTGHVGLAATLGLFALLVLLDAPPLVRFIVAFPAALAASGYLQAAVKFCVAFGVAGVFNFGGHGTTESVADRDARARDRARVIQMMLVIALIAVSVGVAAVLLPI